MANTIEQVNERYQNISSVEPLLDALRTISLGAWQQAINKRGYLQNYLEEITEIFAQLISIVEEDKKSFGEIQKHISPTKNKEPQNTKLLIVVGSERGLCGSFNSTIVEETLKYLKSQSSDQKYELWIVGTRLKRYFKRSGITPTFEYPLSQTTLPDIQSSSELNAIIINHIAQFASVEILYNDYLSVNKFDPKRETLFPFNFPENIESKQSNKLPPIIETDPMNLLNQVLQQMMVFRLHEILMKSATAEHATRFSLMEEASRNADRLLDEISQDIQGLRRQIITREMIELAAGAGLLKSEK